MKIILILIIVLASLSTGAFSGDSKDHIYTTGTILEIDRCASAWLIKRFVDNEAIFELIPDGTLVKNGIAFDTPDAQLRRTHNEATFEAILAKYDLSDPGLNLLASYIHDIEINFLGKKAPEAIEIDIAIKKIIRSADTNEQGWEACFQYFDRFYKEVSENN